MNRIITSMIFIGLLSSCSTSYKSVQTPDDVYYSPASGASEYVVVEKNSSYNPENVPMDDRYLRMKIMSRNRWSSFDEDYTYWNDPHWNNRTYFNTYSNNNILYGGLFNYNSYYFYNPFTPAYYGQPYIAYTNFSKASRSTGPRMVSLNNYAPIKVSNYDPKSLNIQYNNAGGSYNNSGTPRGGYNPANSGTGGSNPIRLFNNNSSSNNSSNTSSSSSSSTGSSSSSSSAPVRSFPRGGGN